MYTRIMKDNIVEMVLTSIVNKDSILNDIVSDIEERFKVSLNVDKARNHLSAIELESKSISIS